MLMCICFIYDSDLKGPPVLLLGCEYQSCEKLYIAVDPVAQDML